MADDVMTLCQKARAALAENNAQLARQCYFQALALSPDIPDVHYGLATASFMLNDFDAAIYNFNAVIRLAPNRIGAYINLGAVYNQMGRPDDALHVLRQAIKLDNTKGAAYYNIGLAYRQKNQIEQAIQAYREALSRDNRMVDAHYNVANLLQDLGRLQQAAEHYKAAMQLNPHFEPAKVGLHQIEMIQQASSTKLSTVTKAAVAAAAAPPSPSGSGYFVDPAQPVDPNLDGGVLGELHRGTTASERTTRELTAVLEQDLEPALKNLSAALLYSNTSVSELQERLEKFQEAMNRIKALQRSWQQNMVFIREEFKLLMLHPVDRMAKDKKKDSSTALAKR
jgi:tetratricopeptide (TPR) repeat protein